MRVQGGLPINGFRTPTHSPGRSRKKPRLLLSQKQFSSYHPAISAETKRVILAPLQDSPIPLREGMVFVRHFRDFGFFQTVLGESIDPKLGDEVVLKILNRLLLYQDPEAHTLFEEFQHSPYRFSTDFRLLKLDTSRVITRSPKVIQPSEYIEFLEQVIKISMGAFQRDPGLERWQWEANDENGTVLISFHCKGEYQSISLQIKPDPESRNIPFDYAIVSEVNRLITPQKANNWQDYSERRLEAVEPSGQDETYFLFLSPWEKHFLQERRRWQFR